MSAWALYMEKLFFCKDFVNLLEIPWLIVGFSLNQGSVILWITHPSPKTIIVGKVKKIKE